LVSITYRLYNQRVKVNYKTAPGSRRRAESVTPAAVLLRFLRPVTYDTGMGTHAAKGCA